jgi:hypothetical protein
VSRRNPPSGEGLTRQQKSRCALLLTRPGWHGAYHTGHRKCVTAAKRTEAARRNELTPHERRRQARTVTP